MVSVSGRRSVVRWWAVFVLALVSAVTIAVPASAGTDRPPHALRVMTQNLYLGADLTPVLGLTDPSEFLGAVAGIYATSRATNFSARAEAVADEIETKAVSYTHLTLPTTPYV